MVNKDTLRLVLDRYLDGRVTQKQVSEWAYEIITSQREIDDLLVTEILYNLVSFRDYGSLFERYHVSREKLEYFINWLEDRGDCGWDQYTTLFDPAKLM